MAAPEASQQLYTLQAGLREFWEFSYDDYQMIGSSVFPVVESNFKAGPFGRVKIEEMLKLEQDTLRAPGTGYARDRATFINDSYFCDEHGREELVDDNDAAAFGSFFSDPYGFATQRAVNYLARSRELRVASQVFDTNVFQDPFGTTITDKWDTAAGTPVTDIENAAQAMFANSGLWPNALIMNRKVFRRLRQNDQLREFIHASGAGYPTRATDVTAQQIGETVDIPMVLVAGGARNTNANPNGAAQISQLWADHAMVCRVATTSDMKEPCIGRTVHWGDDGSSIDGTVERYREENKRSDIVRVRHQTDEKLLLKNLGYLMANVLT